MMSSNTFQTILSRLDFRTRILALSSIGWLCVVSSRLMINTLLPAIKETYVLSNTEAGFLVTSLSITYAIMQLPSGILSDIYGRLRVLYVVIPGLGVTALLIGLAPNFGLFLIFTIVLGVVSGSYYTVSSSLLSDIYQSDQSRAIGIQQSIGSFSGVLAPALATAVIASSLFWGNSFFVFTAISLMLFVLFRYHEDRILQTVANQSDRSGTPNPGKGLSEIVTTLRSQFKSLAVVFTDNYRIVLTVVYSLLMFTRWGVDAFLTVFITDAKGLPLETAATMFAVMYGVGIVIKPVTGELARRVGERLVITTCMVLMAGSLPLLVYFDTVPFILVTVVLFSTGLMGFPPVLQAHFLRLVSPEQRASSFGMYRTTYLLVASLSPVTIGVVADASSFDVMFFVLAGLAGFSALLLVVGARMFGEPAV